MRIEKITSSRFIHRITLVRLSDELGLRDRHTPRQLHTH